MTVASLATTTHSRPAIRPTPVMIPAPGAASSYIPVAASGRELQERARRVEQGVDPLAGQQLAPLDVPDAAALGPAETRDGQPLAQVGDEGVVPARGVAHAPTSLTWSVLGAATGDLLVDVDVRTAR